MEQEKGRDGDFSVRSQGCPGLITWLWVLGNGLIAMGPDP